MTPNQTGGKPKSNRGGKRDHSGRKSEKIRAIQREQVADALQREWTPLAVMHRAMMEHVNAGAWDDASRQAALVAPYVHPKLSNIAHEGAEGGALIVEIIKRSYDAEQK